MNPRNPKILSLVLALASACARQSAAPAPAAPVAVKPTASAPVPYSIDESKLPPVNRFATSDLDPAKTACGDFGGYVNGKWLAANAIPADRTTWGAFEMLDERSTGITRQLAEQAAARPGATGIDKIIGDFYATGMDEAKINAQGLKPLESRLAAIDALADRAAIAEHLRRTYAKGEGFLFGFGPEADFDAPDRVMAYANQGGLGLPDKGYYLDADKKEKLDAYQAHVAKVLELAGATAAQAAAQAKSVIAFETRLAKASKSTEEFSRDVSLFYNPVTLAQADKLTPSFSWSRFFESQGLAAPEKFSLAVPSFHKEVNALLEDAPLDQWKSYLRFRTIDVTSPYLSDAFAQEHFDFYNRKLRGQKDMKARWKRIMDTVDDEAGEAMGQLYVQVAFTPAAKARMQELVKNLSAALEDHLEKLAWMSPATKKRALEKWAGFNAKIGYPDKWRDWSGLTTRRDSYLGNVLASTELNYKWSLGKIGKPVDKLEWGLRPQMVNANYHPLRNEITFPAAILQPPFFDPNADDATNYGGIGAVIGHEMTHGYDDQGSRFGPSGKFENWWSDVDAKGFAARTGKLVAQFSGYEIAPGQKVNGNLTLGENIADLGGLAIAYDALSRATAGTPDAKLDGLTRDQRFFLNWATVWRREHTADELEMRLTVDPHAPAAFRAIGAPSNMEAFAHAFQCKPGDPMVRGGANQIVIW